MKKFDYSFEKILKLKSYIRQEKEIIFAEIAVKVQDLRNKVETNRFVLANGIEEQGDPILYRKYCDRLAAEINYYENEIEKLMDEYNAKKKEYIKAKQEEESFKKLKEKRYKKYLNEYYKEENKVLDETGANQYIRNSNG